MGSRCLLVTRVSGFSRLPVPPASTIPFMESPPSPLYPPWLQACRCKPGSRPTYRQLSRGVHSKFDGCFDAAYKPCFCFDRVQGVGMTAETWAESALSAPEEETDVTT